MLHNINSLKMAARNEMQPLLELINHTCDFSCSDLSIYSEASQHCLVVEVCVASAN